MIVSNNFQWNNDVTYIRGKHALRGRLEDVVLNAQKLDAERQRVLPPDVGHVVVPLEVIAHDHGGTEAVFPERSQARDVDQWQAGGFDIARNVHSRNPGFGGEVLSDSRY